MAEKYARLALAESQQAFELPVYENSQGEEVIDIKALGANALYTFDPGFTATAACESAITFINGEKGILLHRGYPIEQLAKNSDFMEVCYLLVNGNLPSKQEKTDFITSIQKHARPDDDTFTILKNMDPSIHPMAMLSCLVASLGGKFHALTDIKSAQNRKESIVRLIALMPVLAAMIYRHHTGKDSLISPVAELSYSENFLHMMFSESNDQCQVNPVIAKAMDRIFLLHADHEQNASTSTVRLIGSTGADPYVAITGGIAALWGPAHGGANEAVLAMLEQIGDESRIEEFIAKAKDKNDPFRLMGFGHRVYKNFDPRAKVMKQTCHDVLAELGLKDDPLFRIALKLEKEALESDYFSSRKLYPNVDFYSGIILKAIGIPKDMLTVIFALGRTPGWLAQWNEMMEQGYRIGRPRQFYTGCGQRDYVPMNER